MIQVLTPVGRLVQGHPMQSQLVKDKHGLPKPGKDGQPVYQVFAALAVPKGLETDWKQTEWGAAINNEALAEWRNGETQRLDFSWKIEDGDSQVPNKKGKKNCDREGFPGHWIIKASTMLSVKCYHVGKYAPQEVIQNPNEIKCGDYGRLYLEVKSNAPSETPGMYVNPTLFELSRAGEIIVGDGPDAAVAFGGGAPAAAPQAAPTYAAPAPVAPAAPVAPVAPAPDYLNPPAASAPVVKYQTPQGAYTADELRGYGWIDEQINALPVAQ